MKKFSLAAIRGYGLSALVFFLFFGGWELSVYLFQVPAYFIPSPSKISISCWQHLPDLMASFLITFEEAISAFLLAMGLGVTISIIFALSPLLRKACYPYVILFQTIPIISISPLILLWFGNNATSVIVIAYMISVPPIIANVTQGLISIEKNLLDLFKIYDASVWTTLVKLQLPSALPHFFTGLRIACGGAVVGAIVGETFAGSSAVGQGGLGYTAIYAMNQLQTDYLFALVVFSCGMGLLFFFAVTVAECLCLGHWHESILNEQAT